MSGEQHDSAKKPTDTVEPTTNGAETHFDADNHEAYAEDAHSENADNEFVPGNNGDSVLFVGNIPFQTPWQHVKDLFRKAGRVRFTDLIADRFGRPRGSALVTMASPESATRAIEMFNEYEFEGRRLIVRRFENGPRPRLVARQKMPAYGRMMNMRNPMYAPAPFRPQFQPPGMYRPMVEPMGMGRPVAGMQPMMPSGAYRMPHYMPQDSMGMPPMMDDVDVDRPKPRSQQMNEGGRRLFVSNLPFDCTTLALQETFQQVGIVERAEILLGREGKSRGMGIVVMKTPEQARVAIEEFDGIEMANREMKVRLDMKV